MSEKYKFHNEDGIYFITPTIVNWIESEDYVFSSAVDYCGGRGLLDIETIE